MMGNHTERVRVVQQLVELVEGASLGAAALLTELGEVDGGRLRIQARGQISWGLDASGAGGDRGARDGRGENRSALGPVSGSPHAAHSQCIRNVFDGFPKPKAHGRAWPQNGTDSIQSLRASSVICCAAATLPSSVRT
jgi:hypothetical protein